MRSRREPAALLAAILFLSSCSQEHDPEDTGTTSTGTTAASTSEASTPATTGPTGGPAGAYPSLDRRPCPEDSILTAENFGAPFMLTHCTGCHHASLKEGERAGAPLGVDFETLTKVRAQAAKIWARAGDQNATMPPVGPPVQDERTRLDAAPVDFDTGAVDQAGRPIAYADFAAGLLQHLGVDSSAYIRDGEPLHAISA